jgi:alpha-beta hydrolase superfamily lysophospholipase
LSPKRLTRDPAAARAWREDPLIHSRVTGRLFREAERVQRDVRRSGMPRDLPLLFLIPDHDRVVQSSATEAFASGIVDAEVQVEILPGRYHEPLQDLGREEVYALVLDWLDRLLASRS